MLPSATRTRRGRRAGLVGVAATVVLCVAAIGFGRAGIPHDAGGRSAGAATTPGDNVAFWYQPITASTDLGRLGHPRVLVQFSPSNRAANERLAVNRIHAGTGGAAYRYVQLYYLPVHRRMMNISMAGHPDWAFCQTGHLPAYDTSVKTGRERWMFVDANNRGVVDAFRAYLLRVKSWGWDGIFLDLAHRAFTEGFWDRTSTCATNPVVPGRVSADAYAALVPLARSLGLQVMVNGGAPADPALPMRPDPGNAACRAALWSRCRGLDDVVRNATWILHEGASNWSDDTAWLAQIRALATDEVYSRNAAGARVAAFGVYRGPGVDQPAHVVYQWAVMKLYDIPAGFGTGVGRCGVPAQLPIESACNQGAIAPPALVDARLGPPLDASPAARACAADGWHCVWLRRYQDGLVVVNNTASARTTGPIELTADHSCRTVADAVTGARRARGACTPTMDVTLAPYRAQVLGYGTDPPP
jgi:hypothetical protein